LPELALNHKPPDLSLPYNIPGMRRREVTCCRMSSCGDGNVVTFPSTNQAWPCTASKVRQDWAYAGWYGRSILIVD
jgi:hypothetical protein